MSPLHILLTLLLISTTSTQVVTAQVPPDKTFKIINQGKFSDYTTEYNASYRSIQTGNQTNLFSSGPFQLSFYNTTPSAYILAIRAGHPKDESLMRWVWDANRNNPVGENSILSLNRDGNLVLSESNGHIKWQTNTANRGVTGLRLMPNGNLVLHDKNGRFIWQSFDHPSDTLLSGQSLKTLDVNKLVSRKSEADGSDGPYTMVLDQKGLTMYVNKTGPSLAYGGWTERDFNGSVTFDVVREKDNLTVPSAYELVLNLGSATNQENKQRRLLQVRKIGNAVTIILNKINYNGTTSFLRLGSDGSLKAFSYFETETYQKWEETFAFFSDYFVRSCGLPSWCGDYGYCTDGMCVACPTPKGLMGWNEKCSPPVKTTQFCGGLGKNVKYYKIVGVEHFNGPYVDDGDGPSTVSDCKVKCDSDCKCLGFFFKEKTNKCLLAPLLGTLIKDVKTSVGYIKY